jgi:TfoX/Sxy family transcriptional regulator of competence genes
MAWTKSPPELIDLFQSVVPGGAVEQRQMFGYPAAFINGNLFMGLHQDNMILRLADDDRAALLKIDGAKVFEPMAGRPMREYVIVPPSLRTKAKLKPWIEKALQHGTALVPKTKKKKKTASAEKPRPTSRRSR